MTVKLPIHSPSPLILFLLRRLVHQTNAISIEISQLYEAPASMRPIYVVALSWAEFSYLKIVDNSLFALCNIIISITKSQTLQNFFSFESYFVLITNKYYILSFSYFFFSINFVSRLKNASVDATLFRPKRKIQPETFS